MLGAERVAFAAVVVVIVTVANLEVGCVPLRRSNSLSLAPLVSL